MKEAYSNHIQKLGACYGGYHHFVHYDSPTSFWHLSDRHDFMGWYAAVVDVPGKQLVKALFLCAEEYFPRLELGEQERERLEEIRQWYTGCNPLPAFPCHGVDSYDPSVEGLSYAAREARYMVRHLTRTVQSYCLARPPRDRVGPVASYIGKLYDPFELNACVSSCARFRAVLRTVITGADIQCAADRALNG